MSSRRQRSGAEGTRVLAGDIGGTNSRLGLYRHDADGFVQLSQETYPSGEFASLGDVISRFLEKVDGVCEAACLGLPGPVTPDAVINLTNLPWKVDRSSLREILRTDRLELMNDVEASAVGVHESSPDEFACLHPGRPDPRGKRVVISVGTGLGVAGLMPDGTAFATEAGHATFGPRGELDLALLRRLEREFGHVSWERVAAGPALPRIYSLLAPAGSPHLEAPEIVARVAADPVCRETVVTFCRYVGAAAGNIALTLMATGGVFLCGGVAPEVINAVGPHAMLESLVDKGRMRPLLERMPVYLVDDDSLALTGAAHVALRSAEHI